MLGWYLLLPQISSNISVDIGSESDSLPDDIASIYDSLINGGRVDSDSKFPSSNCVNMIISPVCYLGDVAQGGYVAAGKIAIASE